MLSKEAINSFKEIYKTRFGVDLNDTDAYEKGTKLLQLMSLIYQPIAEKENGTI